jgi:hypothetical protein
VNTLVLLVVQRGDAQPMAFDSSEQRSTPPNAFVLLFGLFFCPSLAFQL